MKAPLYDQTGAKKGDVTLNKMIFEIEASQGTVHEYLVYQQANARKAVAHAKGRSEVRGGGRKPFRQKGTGRARQGSIRNIHMRGGGRAFGPKSIRNFSKMMPKQMRRKALFALLSTKAKDGKVMAVEKFELQKTKEFAHLISKLPVERNVLVVANREEAILRRASKNLDKSRSKTITSAYLNPADLMKYEAVLFTQTALQDLENTYASKK